MIDIIQIMCWENDSMICDGKIMIDLILFPATNQIHVFSGPI